MAGRRASGFGGALCRGLVGLVSLGGLAGVVGLAELVGLAGCDEAAEAQGPGVPLILEVRPEAAAPGEVVAVLGRHFGLQGAQDGLFLGGVPLAVESWADDAVLARLPQAEGLPRGNLGTFDLVLRAGALVSRPFAFEVRAAPEPLDAGPVADVGSSIP
jgi:hypothetical protein